MEKSEVSEFHFANTFKRMVFGDVVLSHQSLCATDYILFRFYCITVVISTGGVGRRVFFPHEENISPG